MKTKPKSFDELISSLLDEKQEELKPLDPYLEILDALNEHIKKTLELLENAYEHR